MVIIISRPKSIIIITCCNSYCFVATIYAARVQHLPPLVRSKGCIDILPVMSFVATIYAARVQHLPPLVRLKGCTADCTTVVILLGNRRWPCGLGMNR